MGRPDWPEIRRLASELSTATASLRQSLIKNDFDIGPLIPVKEQCESICLALNEVLELPLGEVDGDMTTTVTQAMDAAMDLKGQLATLINIGTSLTDNPGVKDRVELEKSWFRCSRKAIPASRGTASMLQTLVQIIGLQAPHSGDSTDADTAS